MAIDYHKLPRVDISNIKGCEYAKELTREEILDDKKRKEIIREIKANCDNRYFWALLGKNSQTDDKWVCLQCASSKNIASEIAADIKCMLPIDENDDILWNSHFHKGVFRAEYARNIRCQKYRDMLDKFPVMCFVIIDHEKFLSDTDTGGYGRLDYAETKFAYDTQSLYWKPIKDQYKILKILESGCN